MKITAMGIGGLLAAAVFGCSSKSDVDIGDDRSASLGASQSDYAGTWEGYAEAYTFLDDTDRVRLTLDSTGNGTLELGNDRPGLPAPDPDSAPPGWQLMGNSSVDPGLLIGYPFTVTGATIESTRIKLTSQGEVGPAGGPPGDVYLEVRERRHEVFTRDGDDLHATLSVPMTAAALGTVLTLETLDGEQEVDLRPGTQPEQVVTLKGLGVGHLHVGGRGDLHVQVIIETPKHLTKRQEELLRELAEIEKKQVTPQRKSFFEKIKALFVGEEEDRKDKT